MPKFRQQNLSFCWLKLLQPEFFSIFLDLTLDDVIENLTLSVWVQKVIKIWTWEISILTVTTSKSGQNCEQNFFQVKSRVMVLTDSSVLFSRTYCKTWVGSIWRAQILGFFSTLEKRNRSFILERKLSSNTWMWNKPLKSTRAWQFFSLLRIPRHTKFVLWPIFFTLSLCLLQRKIWNKSNFSLFSLMVKFPMFWKESSMMTKFSPKKNFILRFLVRL